MSRRGQISKRDVLPDPLYNSKLVTKLMYDGKKGVAQKIVYDAFAEVEENSVRTRLKHSRKLLRMLCLFSKLRLVV